MAKIEVEIEALTTDEFEELVNLRNTMADPDTRDTLEEKDVDRLKLLSLRAGVVQSNERWEEIEERVQRLDRKISKGTEKIEHDMAELQSTMEKVLTIIDKIQPIKQSRPSNGFGGFDPIQSSSMYKKEPSAEGQPLVSAAGQNAQHGHLIAWPVRKISMMESDGRPVQWMSTEPKDAANLIKLIKRDITDDTTDKFRHKMREMAIRIAAYAESHFLTDDVIMGIIRQVLHGGIREYFNTLVSHGVEPEKIWAELQLHGETPFTSEDAIRELAQLVNAPAGVKLAEVNIKLPPLVRVRYGGLGETEDEKARLVELTIDEMYAFLIVNVKNSLITPLVEERYRRIKQFIRECRDGGRPGKELHGAYCKFYNELLEVPQLKECTFRTKGVQSTSGLQETDQKTHGQARPGPSTDNAMRPFTSGNGAPRAGQNHPPPPFTPGQGQTGNPGRNPGYGPPAVQGGYSGFGQQGGQGGPQDFRQQGPKQHFQGGRQGFGQQEGQGGRQGFGQQGGQGGQQGYRSTGGRPTPNVYPTDLAFRCHNCYGDDHRSRECALYEGAYPAEPVDANRCGICFAFHKGHCAMPGLWASRRK
jgi:hypothetical protein